MEDELTYLPNEIWSQIFQSLDGRSLDHISATCSLFRNLIHNNPSFFAKKSLKAKMCHLPFRFLGLFPKINSNVQKQANYISDTLRLINFEKITIGDFSSKLPILTVKNVHEELSSLSAKGLIFIFLVDQKIKIRNTAFINCLSKMIDLLLKEMTTEEKGQLEQSISKLSKETDQVLFTRAKLNFYAKPLPEDYDHFNAIEPDNCKLI